MNRTEWNVILWTSSCTQIHQHTVGGLIELRLLPSVSFHIRTFGRNKRLYVRSDCFDLVQTAAVIIGLFIEPVGVPPPWESAFISSDPCPRWIGLFWSRFLLLSNVEQLLRPLVASFIHGIFLLPPSDAYTSYTRTEY